MDLAQFPGRVTFSSAAALMEEGKRDISRRAAAPAAAWLAQLSPTKPVSFFTTVDNTAPPTAIMPDAAIGWALCSLNAKTFMLVEYYYYALHWLRLIAFALCIPGITAAAAGSLRARSTISGMLAASAAALAFHLAQLCGWEHYLLEIAFPSSCPRFTLGVRLLLLLLIAALAYGAFRWSKGRIQRLALACFLPLFVYALILSIAAALTPSPLARGNTFPFAYDEFAQKTAALPVEPRYCQQYMSDLLLGFGELRQRLLFKYGIYGHVLPSADGIQADAVWRPYAAAAVKAVHAVLNGAEAEINTANQALAKALETSALFPAWDARREFTFRTIQIFARSCYLGCKDTYGSAMFKLCQENGYAAEPWCIRALIMHHEEAQLPW